MDSTATHTVKQRFVTTTVTSSTFKRTKRQSQRSESAHLGAASGRRLRSLGCAPTARRGRRDDKVQGGPTHLDLALLPSFRLRRPPSATTIATKQAAVAGQSSPAHGRRLGKDCLQARKLR